MWYSLDRWSTSTQEPLRHVWKCRASRRLQGRGRHRRNWYLPEYLKCYYQKNKLFSVIPRVDLEPSRSHKEIKFSWWHWRGPIGNRLPPGADRHLSLDLYKQVRSEQVRDVGDWVLLSVVLPYGKILQSQEGKNLAETLNWDLIPGSWSMLLLAQAALVPHHPAILGGRRLSSLSGWVHQPRSPLLQGLVRMCLNPSFHETSAAWPTYFGRPFSTRAWGKADGMGWKVKAYPAGNFWPQKVLMRLMVLSLHQTSLSFSSMICVFLEASQGARTHTWNPPACWVRAWRGAREWWRLEGMVGGAVGRGRFHLRGVRHVGARVQEGVSGCRLREMTTLGSEGDRTSATSPCGET